MALKINVRAAVVVAIIVAAIVAVVCFVLPSIMWGVIGAANRLMVRIPRVLPFIPLILYGIFGIVIKNHLWKTPRDVTAAALDRQEASSLSLAGFCFTSISLLLSFFKEEIKDGKATPQGIYLGPPPCPDCPPQ